MNEFFFLNFKCRGKKLELIQTSREEIIDDKIGKERGAIGDLCGAGIRQ